MMQNYYTFIQQYWTGIVNKAATNIEADLGNYALSVLNDEISNDAATINLGQGYSGSDSFPIVTDPKTGVKTVCNIPIPNA